MDAVWAEDARERKGKKMSFVKTRTKSDHVICQKDTTFVVVISKQCLSLNYLLIREIIGVVIKNVVKHYLYSQNALKCQIKVLVQ